MKTHSICLLVLGLIITASCKKTPDNWSVTSPGGNLMMEISLQAETGALQYQVKKQESDAWVDVVNPSPLGITRADADFTTSLSFSAAEAVKTIDETYTLVHGKQLQNRDHCNELALTFQNAEGKELVLVCRAYDEGVAFRYRFPGESTDLFTVNGETTGFAIPTGGKAWMHPYDEVLDWAPAYETFYMNAIEIGSKAPGKEGWAFPMLFESSGSWILITETDLDGSYCGTHIQPDATGGLYTIRFPEPEEARETGPMEPSWTLPWTMPWRVIIVGNNPGTIVESNLVNHLATPSKIEDTSWVIPGRSSWSWWSDHASSRSVKAMKPFFDLSKEMGWEYSLIDANWNIMVDGDVMDLIKHAEQTGVGALLWYNSGGPHNVVTEQPRDLMLDPATRLAEFEKIAAWGAKGVKVDFFQSDKQHVIQQYMGILEDAAKHKILVNFHGCTLPRGWARTWPNMMTLEAVRGGEAYSFDAKYPANAPWHNVILVFTRNVVGPMDYTPVTFSDQTNPHITSYGHELALGVLFESGIQHLADRVSAYKALPEAPKNYLKALPVVWDESRFVAGYPGDHVILARRAGETWYIAGINGTAESREVSFTLPFLADSGSLELITDGLDNKSFGSTQVEASAETTITVSMLPFGGFAGTLK